MVYFILQGDQYVKIGYCRHRGSLGDRLNELQIGNPSFLDLAMAIDRNRDFEGDLHKRFQSYHVRGEWFYLSSEIEEYMEAISDDNILCSGKKTFRMLRKGRGRVFGWV